MTDLVIIISKYSKEDGSYTYIGTCDKFYKFIDERKDQDGAKIFNADAPNGGQFLKLSKNNVSYYIFCGTHSRDDYWEDDDNKFKNSATGCIVSAIKKIREKLENVPIKCFLHRCDFNRFEIERPGVETYEFRMEEIVGISFLSMTDIMNWLMEEKDARSLAAKDFFFEKRVIENIVETLQPLHLALQAFFGVNLNEENKEWKKLPGERRDEIKKNYPVLFSEDKRQNAFLLVKEAEYDFFAEIGCRLGPPGDLDPNVLLEEQPLLTLIKEMVKKNKNDMEEADNKDLEGKKIKGEPTRQEIEKIFADNEGNELRTLCSILANIEDEGINPTYLNSGQLSQKEVDKHKNRIKTSKDVLSQYKNCIKWLDEKRSHTKWPEDLDSQWNEPAKTYKDNLVKQLNRWNDEGKDEPAQKKALRQIDAIIHYLEQIQIYLNRVSHDASLAMKR